MVDLLVTPCGVGILRRAFSLIPYSHRATAMTAVAATLSRPVCAGLTVYVAFLLTQSGYAAQGPYGSTLNPEPDPVSSGSPATPAPVPPPPGSPTSYGPLPPAPPFRDSIYGAYPNPGPPGAPGYLHPHYPEYQTRYGIWYQPRSFQEPMKEPYRPSPFRPRGWGNLFYDPCLRDRIDYNRYVVEELPSRYGPSYYPKYTPAAECLIRPERAYSPPVWGSAE